ncbi:MAG: hypothetical protein ABIR16_04440, partial [Dokdonella sp.]
MMKITHATAACLVLLCSACNRQQESQPIYAEGNNFGAGHPVDEPRHNEAVTKYWPEEKQRFANLAIESKKMAALLEGKPPRTSLKDIGAEDTTIQHGGKRSDPGNEPGSFQVDAKYYQGQAEQSEYFANADFLGSYAYTCTQSEKKSGENCEFTSELVGPDGQRRKI